MKKRYTHFKHIPIKYTESFNFGQKLVSDLCGFTIFCSDNVVDFDEEILSFLLVSKIKTYLLNVINTKKFCNPPIEKYFAPLIILHLFIKSTVNPFVDIILNFFLDHLV